MTISTASAPKYWESTYLNTVLVDGQPVPDLLSDRLPDLISSITLDAPYTVKEGDKLTTICYNFYQTTSLYYLLLYYNGLLFWDEVQPGDIIRVPDLTQVNNFFGRNREQIGTRITI